jgi:hypothetical protein
MEVIQKRLPGFGFGTSPLIWSHSPSVSVLRWFFLFITPAYLIDGDFSETFLAEKMNPAVCHVKHNFRETSVSRAKSNSH